MLLTCSSNNILLLGLNSAINSMLYLSKNVAVSTYDSEKVLCVHINMWTSWARGCTWIYILYNHKHAYITDRCMCLHSCICA